APVDPGMVPYGVAPQPREPIQGDGEDPLADPIFSSPTQQPPYRSPDMTRPSPAPLPPRQEEGEGGSALVDPFMDPFANLDDAPPSGAPAPVYPGDPGFQTPLLDGTVAPPYVDGGIAPYAPSAVPLAPDEPLMAAPYTPPPPEVTAIEALNVGNPYFPGLGEAQAAGNLNMAGAIVWETLKRRRVVDATMVRGPGGSWGQSSPYEAERLMNALTESPQGAEDPLRAANRINVILDSFSQPLIEDPTIGAAMPAMLVRLHDDTNRVRHALALYTDEGVFLELSRTYIRAVTSCDFFYNNRKNFAVDIRDIMDRAATMFYEDGASRGGDVAGLTGNLFRILLMLDHYTRDDSSFRRDIGSVWSVLQRPARYVLDLACPDWTLPAYGPRGSRELQPLELEALDAIFPPPPTRVNRIGLAASYSYPPASNLATLGGIYVMQDEPNPLGRYLSVRFGPYGDLLNVPSHSDFGSLVLMSRGVKYMQDAGGYGGQAATGAAHGGLSLDGNYATQASYNLPGSVADAVWRTNASLDYATDMAAFEDGKTWQRSVLYVKNLPGESRSDYWVVLDHVNMQGDPQPRTAVVRYQMQPGLQVYNDGGGVLASSLSGSGSGLRMFAVDAGAVIDVTDGGWGSHPGYIYDSAGGAAPAPSVTVTRQLTGDSTTTTLLYPADDYSHRPIRIERDADIIRGRTGAVVVDHGLDRIDVIAWASPGTELVTPTLNLQLSADLAVFRLRRGKIARIDLINLERGQAKEPDGGRWSMRVNGPAQSLVILPEAGGGWQVWSDAANRGSATLFDVNFGPTVARRRFSIRPGEMRVVPR
ncbi:MAG: heparinase II/III family protein, partial [Planctomycetaceae bacterium]|nr:heparinase II/III family protein [Planctomycetaceae bacterium]